MPKFFNILAAGLILAVGSFASQGALAADVEVDFSSKLTRNMGSLNQMEQKYEEFFRKYYTTYRTSTVQAAAKFNSSRFENVNWAGEELIPNLADFTVANLTVALVTESLDRAGMGNLDGTIRVTIERLKVSNHSLSMLRSGDSYVIGRFELLNDSGAVVRSAKISTNLVYDSSVDVNYQGPDYAFYTSDAANRVGPTLARFVEKGLEALFEGQTFTGVVLIGS